MSSRFCRRDCWLSPAKLFESRFKFLFTLSKLLGLRCFNFYFLFSVMGRQVYVCDFVLFVMCI